MEKVVPIVGFVSVYGHTDAFAGFSVIVNPAASIFIVSIRL
jgi:hypothetical protein